MKRWNNRILCVKGHSQYNAMRTYIDQIAKAAEQEGYEVIVLDATEADSYLEQYVKAIQENEFDFIFVCNGILWCDAYRDFSDNFWVSYFCDHPEYQRWRLEAADERMLAITCDRNHQTYIEKHFDKNIAVKFLPLPGIYCENIKDYEQRTIPVLFTATYSKPGKEIEFYEKLNHGNRLVAEKIFASLMNDPSKTVEQAVDDMLTEFHIELNENEYVSVMRLCVQLIVYVRAYYRDWMVRSILQAHIKVHVYGHGWETFEGEGKEYLVLCDGDEKEALEALGDTKIALNSMPWFKNGFQERIASAMLNGAVAVTDTSTYIEEHYVNGQDLLVLALKDIKETGTKVKWLLEHPKEAEHIAANGKEKAKQLNTWQVWTQQMLEMAKECSENWQNSKKNRE